MISFHRFDPNWSSYQTAVSYLGWMLAALVVFVSAELRAWQTVDATKASDSANDQAAASTQQIEQLSGKVVQLLQAKCSSCHGSDQHEGGFRVDSREQLFKGGDRGAAIIKGEVQNSLLYRCVSGQEADLLMPPKNPLDDAEIELIKLWLAAGASWPESISIGGADSGTLPQNSAEQIGDAWTDHRNPIRRIFGGQRLGLWSLLPVKQIELPHVEQEQWCKNEIDYFALAKFESAGVKPPEQADRHTLLRRVYFDLTGLPPSPEASLQFKNSKSDNDIQKLVDQLIDSPAFGIHWARMWLDVARYSDSNGFDWDEFRPQAWRYRDYVIRSLNQDKPYDQFLREQLAGDEMVADSPEDWQQQDALIATGFLRMGPHDNAAKLFNEQDRSRDELLTDLVETTGSAILGLTLSCCRCHDHKYDPLSQADHFRLRACFAGVQFADDTPIDLAKDRTDIDRFNEAIDSRISELEQRRNEILQAIESRLEMTDQQSTSDTTPHQTDTDHRSESSSPTTPASSKQESSKRKPDELKKAANEDETKQLDEVESQIEQLRKQKRPLTYAMLMLDSQPEATFVLFQGNYKSPLAKVEPGVLSILNPNTLLPGKTTRKETSGRRTALADWIVSPENPLTARVMVNRVWQNLFGQGLVRTPGDFGLAGSPPEDQQLLDYLAKRFVTDGWSIKRLIRLIMLSATYQQAASFREPLESVSHVIRRPRRLTAEQLRDSMLAVSGLLTDQDSGPPKWPELPQDVLEANPAFLDDNETKTKGWYPSPRSEQYCRSIFLVQKRNTRVPILETLDQPENSVSCQKRASSIVAPQALSLLNSPEAIQAAKSFAERLVQHSTSVDDQVDLAFQLTLSRQPTAVELEQSLQLIEGANLMELCRALLNVNEFAYID